MLDRNIKFNNLKEMISISHEKFGNRPAFYIEGDNLDNSRVVTYNEYYEDINSLGTAMLEMGLKGKKIALISENRYEWEVA